MHLNLGPRALVPVLLVEVDYYLTGCCVFRVNELLVVMHQFHVDVLPQGESRWGVVGQPSLELHLHLLDCALLESALSMCWKHITQAIPRARVLQFWWYVLPALQCVPQVVLHSYSVFAQSRVEFSYVDIQLIYVFLESVLPSLFDVVYFLFHVLVLARAGVFLEVA